MECILRYWVVEEYYSKKCYVKNIIYSQYSKMLICLFFFILIYSVII